MTAYLAYSLFMAAFVYPVVVHSIWSTNGFLSAFSLTPFMGSGCLDFAGGGVVHLTGGTTALVATCILGARKGRFTNAAGEQLEKPKIIPGHSISLQMLGTLTLWFGCKFFEWQWLVCSQEGSSQPLSLRVRIQLWFGVVVPQCSLHGVRRRCCCGVYYFVRCCRCDWGSASANASAVPIDRRDGLRPHELDERIPSRLGGYYCRIRICRALGGHFYWCCRRCTLRWCLEPPHPAPD